MTKNNTKQIAAARKTGGSDLFADKGFTGRPLQVQPLFDLAFQRSAAEDDKTEEGDDAQDQADDPRDAVGVQLAAVQTQKEQDVRQRPMPMFMSR